MADSKEQAANGRTQIAASQAQDAKRSTPNQEPRVLCFPKFSKPTVRATLWDARGRPGEDTLRTRLTEEGYGVVRWANEPATGYPPHAHIYPELLWLVSGNLTIILPAEKRLLELFPGDRVEVPQGVVHGTMAGAEGAVYLLATR
jgi:quercetin dioxygenase-like cupin family protein